MAHSTAAHHQPRAWLRAWHVDRAPSGRGGRHGAWLGAWLAERDGHRRQARLVGLRQGV